MTLENLLAELPSKDRIPEELENRLNAASERLSAYKFIAERDPCPYRELLLRLFHKEIAFRKALWSGSTRDEMDFGESIYHCAFLLCSCGNADDTFAIWKAQYLNQDIGELDAEYFVGAGIEETLAFLRKSPRPTANEIVHHIRTWVSWGGAPDSVARWRKGRQDWIRDA